MGLGIQNSQFNFIDHRHNNYVHLVIIKKDERKQVEMIHNPWKPQTSKSTEEWTCRKTRMDNWSLYWSEIDENVRDIKNPLSQPKKEIMWPDAY